MDNKLKFLIGGLIAVNVGLVGMLLFREHSITPASAQNEPPAAVAATPLAERAGGTTFAPAEPAAATTTAATVPLAPESPAMASMEREPAPPVEYAPEPSARGTNGGNVREADTYEPASAPAPKQPQRKTEPRAEPREKTQVATRLPATTAPREQSSEARNHEERGSDDFWTQATDARTAELEGERNAPEEMSPPVPPPAPAPVAPLRPTTVTIPAGTHLPIKLDVALHSRQVRSGDRFEASLADDLIVAGRTVAEAGSPVTGRVLEVSEAGRVKGREQMKVTISEVTLAGKVFPVEASTLSFSAQEDTNRDAGVIGGTTALGAIIGAIAKGGRGAAAGAATGAATGTGIVLSTKGRPVVLTSGSRLDFTLEDSIRVTLPPSRSREAVPDQKDRKHEDDDRQDQGVGISRRY